MKITETTFLVRKKRIDSITQTYHIRVRHQLINQTYVSNIDYFTIIRFSCYTILRYIFLRVDYNFYYGESQKTKNVSPHDRNMGLPSNFYDKSMNSLRTKLRLNISLYQ